MLIATIVILAVRRCQADNFEWVTRPAVQYACAGSDTILHWKYKTETPVGIVLLQNAGNKLTLVECHGTSKDSCDTYPQYRGRVKVLEMTQSSALYRISNLNTNDSAEYLFSLLGPDVTDSVTLSIFTRSAIQTEWFVNNEPVEVNGSYTCTEQCSSIPVLVKTHMSLGANISFYDVDSNLLLSCINKTTCVYIIREDGENTAVKVEVNYGFCDKITSYLEISVKGQNREVIIIVLVLVFTLLFVVGLILGIRWKHGKAPWSKKKSFPQSSDRTVMSSSSDVYYQMADKENGNEDNHITESESVIQERRVLLKGSDDVPVLAEEKVMCESQNEESDRAAARKSCVEQPEKEIIQIATPEKVDTRQDSADDIVAAMQKLNIDSSEQPSGSEKQHNFTKYRERKKSDSSSDNDQGSVSSKSSVSMAASTHNKDSDVEMRDISEMNAVNHSDESL